MAAPSMVAVQATDPRFLVLKHQPDGIGFDANGTAIWPADQFTFALLRDGAVRLVDNPAAVPKPAAVQATDVIPILRNSASGSFTVADLVSFLAALGIGTGTPAPSTDTASAALLPFGLL